MPRGSHCGLFSLILQIYTKWRAPWLHLVVNCIFKKSGALRDLNSILKIKTIIIMNFKMFKYLFSLWTLVKYSHGDVIHESSWKKHNSITNSISNHKVHNIIKKKQRNKTVFNGKHSHCFILNYFREKEEKAETNGSVDGSKFAF